MKNVLLFLILINLSLFSQSNEYINELYYAIKYNSAKGISNAVEYFSIYDLDLNNIFSEKVEVYGDMERWDANASPLIYAIKCGNIAAIDTLLKLGANVERLTDIYSPYGFISFISFNDYEMEWTTNINITPLMYAAYCKNDEVVSFLIKKGAKVNSKNIEGKTALMYGPSKVLINAGADVNTKDNEGKTALMYAAYGRAKGSVDLLIKNKANVNAKDNYGYTALMYACMHLKNLATVKSLIRAGANLNEVNDTLAAIVAMVSGRADSPLLCAIRAYIREGCDNLSDGAIGTYETIGEYEASSEAACGLELIKFLIDNGANVNINIGNKEGQTPLSLSEEFPKLTKLLRDNGAYLE